MLILEINTHKCLYFNMKYYLNLVLINSPQHRILFVLKQSK